MSILVAGGAGYIGSVVVDSLLASGQNAVVIDNLVYGYRDSVDPSAAFYERNIGDPAIVGEILQNHEITGCRHFFRK